MRMPSIFTTDEYGKLVVSDINGEVTNEQLLLEKIIKFLLTIPGSNLADLNYGSLLGDKALLAKMGNELSAVNLLIVNAVDTANTYFKGEPLFKSMQLNNLFVSEEDPTVFYAEIFVYLTDGSIITITA